MKTSNVAGLAALALLCGCLEFDPQGLYACDPAAGEVCDQDGGTGETLIIPGNDGSTPNFDAGPNAVIGQSLNYYVSSKAAPTSSPDDLSSGVEAYLLDGGAFITLAGVGRKDGTFYIPNVPPGATYYVRVGGDTSVTNARTLDFSDWTLGSANRGYARLSTPVTINISNVSTWTNSDVMQMVSLKAGLDYFYLPPFPAVGSGPLVTANPDFQYWPLINTGAGDKVDISQLVADTADGGYTYSALRKTFSPTSVQMTDGMALSISGALVDLPASLPVTVDWKRSEFVAQRAGMTPTQGTYYSYTNIYAVPQGNTLGTYFYGPHLTQYYSENLGTDVVMTFNFANPFADTDLTGYTATSFNYDYALAGATTPLTYTASVGGDDGVAAFSAGPLRPRLGPVRNARINNIPVTGANNVAGQAITNASLNPTFVWDAPTLGSPNLYRVEIFELRVNNAGQTVAEFIATVHTRELRAVIPPKTLTAGRQYFARINAIADVNRSPERPYRKSHPAALSQVLTVIFSP
ncbi:MAG: hypothetical protein ACT4TC_11100 [Myxococcaceae bacterium]